MMTVIPGRSIRIPQPTPQDVPNTLLEDLLDVLEAHVPHMDELARERACKAFSRSIQWMIDNPAAWEAKPVQARLYIDEFDKPVQRIVRGSPVSMYKANAVTGPLEPV